MKGLIVEKQTRCHIVLTPTGEYKKVRGAVNEEIGQEVTIKSCRVTPKAAVAAAVLMIVIFLSQALPAFIGQNQAYAYVTLDINPSVEFAIDADYKVLSARPYNEDAESILSELEYTGKDIGPVLADFTQSAITHQHIGIDSDKGSRVVVSFYSAHTKDEESAHVELDRITKEQREILKQSGGQADINTVVVDKETHKEADRLGISAGMLEKTKVKENDLSQVNTLPAMPVKHKEGKEKEDKSKETKIKVVQSGTNGYKKDENNQQPSENKQEAIKNAWGKNHKQAGEESIMNPVQGKKENNFNPNKNKLNTESNSGRNENGMKAENSSARNQIKGKADSNRDGSKLKAKIYKGNKGNTYKNNNNNGKGAGQKEKAKNQKNRGMKIKNHNAEKNTPKFEQTSNSASSLIA